MFLYDVAMYLHNVAMYLHNVLMLRTEGLDRFRGLPSYTRFGQSDRTQKRHGTTATGKQPNERVEEVEGGAPKQLQTQRGKKTLLNSESSTRLYGMRLTAALYNGAIRGQPVDSHVIICHTSVTCETSLLCLYIYHIRRVNMI